MNGGGSARRFLAAGAAALCVLAGTVIGRFADDAMPPSYLVRPLGVCVVVALVIGAIAFPLRRNTTSVAAALALILSLTQPLTILLVAAAGIFITLYRIRGGALNADRGALALAALFLALAFTRAIPQILEERREAEFSNDSTQTIAIILLDGYPRADTLRALGIDNQSFVQSLRELGFDDYPLVRSSYGWTALTLTALLTDASPPDRALTPAQKRLLRNGMEPPPGFRVASPPVGHVSIPGTTPAYGINDFEAHLLGDSIVGRLASDAVRGWIVDNIHRQAAEMLTRVGESAYQRVFAHVLAPHPPFPDGPSCWPNCHVFDNVKENLGVSTSGWADGMRANLRWLNPLILQTARELIAADPNAVIVLFSDHGGRYSNEHLEEWHRSFLTARTPGRSRLFEGARTEDVLDLILRAYP